MYTWRLDNGTQETIEPPFRERYEALATTLDGHFTDDQTVVVGIVDPLDARALRRRVDEDLHVVVLPCEQGCDVEDLV
jgi:hypothetical protein